MGALYSLKGPSIDFWAGILNGVACAPETMSREQVEAEVKALEPENGTTHGWRIRDENPCRCSDHPDCRHWLVEC